MKRKVVSLDQDESARLVRLAKERGSSEADTLVAALDRLESESWGSEFRDEGLSSYGGPATSVEVLFTSSPLPTWQRQMLAERVAEDDADPQDGSSWVEVKSRVLAAL